MSLSDLFGDLDDEEDEEDYHPDAADISDIGSADEVEQQQKQRSPAPQEKKSSFSLADELLEPMKPPEFDSDEDVGPTTRIDQKQSATISSDDAEETSDLRQLNKNLFGSDNEMDEDDPPLMTEQVESKPVQDADKFFHESDDEDEKLSRSQKTTAADLFGSDVEDESDEDKPDATTAATQEEIFGSDVSVSDEEGGKQQAEPKAAAAAPSKPDSDDEMHNLHRVARSDGESDEDKADEESELPVEMPLVDINLGENLNLVKLPNFISIDTRPFDAETYEDEIEDDNEITDDEGRARLKLKVENTIRWRHALDDRGNLIKQSNSRVVKWSDGSVSLFVGTEEFDILQVPLTGANSHLYVKHGAGIQGQAQFHNKMMFRIHSTDSYTHRKMTLRVSDRVSKSSKVKTLPAVGRNPEAKREELCKREDERLAAQRRRENMQKKMREKNMSKTLSTRYLEPDMEEDEEGESLAAIKNSYKSGAASKKQKSKKQKKVSEVYSSEEEEEEMLLEDEEEEEEEAVETDSDSDKKKQKKKPAVIDDEEESD